MKVGLGPGHIVLHGDPAPLPKIKKGQIPIIAFAWVIGKLMQ